MMMSEPIHILHVVGGMTRGGIETWLMHVLRHIDRDRFQMDFLVHTTQPCAYDDEIRSLGSRIIPCMHPSRPWAYAQNFNRILRDDRPYAIVHSHVHHYSGYILSLAHRAGVPVRIVHSHNDTVRLQSKAKPLRRSYLALMRHWIDQHATRGLAASRKAAVALYGPTWEADPRYALLYYGVDLTPFQQAVDPLTVRAELGIPPDAFVIGHVGRFHEQKNHEFLVDIAAEVARQDPRMRLLLIGDGPLRPMVEQKIAQLGLTDRVVFAGLRSDVPRLMLGAMDVLLFPSLYEGLPITGIEAQAAGLPIIMSDVITDELGEIKPLIRRIPLSRSASEWSREVLNSKKSSVKMTSEDSLKIVNRGLFDIQTCVKNLEGLYSKTREVVSHDANT